VSAPQGSSEQVVDYPIVAERALEVDPIYRQLQQHGPIRVRMPYGEVCWLATRYEDIRTVHGDRRFTKELGLVRDIPRLREGAAPKDPNMLASMDPPRHTRIRRLASASFSPPSIRRMRARVGELVDELLDQMENAGRPEDFFSCVSWSLPNLVVTGILGVSRSDVPAFRSFIDRMLATDATPEERVSAHEGLRAYIVGLIEERRRHPTDDVLGTLVDARDLEDRLTEDELVMLCLNLFLGGFETTVSQLGSTLYVLMTERHLWQELVEDRTLLPAALEEMWRWIPSHRYGTPLVRWASEDIELSGGVVIPVGDPVLPERVAGNRDESVFPDGWELDFHRDEPAPHLALGFGPHHCLGAPLARLEIEVTVDKMLDRFPALELAVPNDSVRWSTTSFMRCVEALPVSW
jgi:cytochrome P450 RapN/nocardicin N-oxygenase